MSNARSTRGFIGRLSRGGGAPSVFEISSIFTSPVPMTGFKAWNRMGGVKKRKHREGKRRQTSSFQFINSYHVERHAYIFQPIVHWISKNEEKMHRNTLYQLNKLVVLIKNEKWWEKIWSHMGLQPWTHKTTTCQSVQTRLRNFAAKYGS